jgi:hypothetical protein
MPVELELRREGEVLVYETWQLNNRAGFVR